MSTPSRSPDRPPPLRIPFTTLIDADHDKLTSLAARIRQFQSSSSHDHSSSTSNLESSSEPASIFVNLLAELTWRLIRHDVSEELVMRPAFEERLGSEGRAMADRDRKDHADIKKKLIRLWQTSNTPAHTTSRLFDNNETETEASQKSSPLPRFTMHMILDECIPLLAEMRQHMKEESGRQLPQFAEAVGEEECLNLGRMYMTTLVVGPDLEIPSLSKEGNDQNRSGIGVSRSKCFKIGIMEYMTTSLQRFNQIHDTVQKGFRAGDGYEDYLSGKLREELELLGLAEVESTAMKEHFPRGTTKVKL